jgi:hypothetical protein
MRRFSRRFSLFFSPAALALPVLFATAAIGHAAPDAAPAPAGAAAAPEKVVGPPEVAWKDMTVEQRGKYMKAVVTPKMKVLFQDYDAGLFEKVNCATCHGKDAKARKFKMPSPELHPLPATPAAFQAALKKKPSWPKWTKFMSEKVEPQMAALLGMVPFDPKKPNPAAFSCMGCHTLEGKGEK